MATLSQFLSNALANLDAALGYTPNVTSGIRTPQHNADVGGVSNSYHLAANGGLAVDLTPPAGVSMSQMYSDIQNSGIGHIELLNEGNHVHVAFAPTDALTGAAGTLANNQDWFTALIDDTLQGIGGVPDLPATVAKKAGDAVANATNIWSVFTEGVWTRFSFGLVGALLIAAAIFILLGGPKVVVQTAKTAAKAAIAA